MVHLRLPADCAAVRFFPGPGRVHQHRGLATGASWVTVGEGRAGFRRRHRGAHQRRGRGPGRCVRGRQAPIGLGREAIKLHNLTKTMVGASILWVGWSASTPVPALETGGVAAMAFANTFLATAAAVVVVAAHGGMDGKELAAGRSVRCGGGPGRRSPRRRAWSASTAHSANRRHRRRCCACGRQRRSACSVRTTAWTCSRTWRWRHHRALLTGVFAAPSLGGAGLADDVTETALPDYASGGRWNPQAQERWSPWRCPAWSRWWPT